MITQLHLLGSLHGRFTESRLTAMGFQKPVIRRAITIGLMETSGGIVSSIPPRLRAAKLKFAGVSEDMGTSDLQPGATVQRVVDGVIKTFQVVRQEGGDLVLIDPENTGAGEQRCTRSDISPVISDPNEPGDPPTPDSSNQPKTALSDPKPGRMPYA
jgi:hypothetical protein